MVSEEEVLKALQPVNGPDGKTPLPQSGAIAGPLGHGRQGLSLDRGRALARRGHGRHARRGR